MPQVLQSRHASRRPAHCAAILVLLLPCGLSAQLVSEPAYVGGRAAWQRGQWTTAIENLRPLVDPQDRANYEVDYWLGTSLCRLDARLSQGANILDWSLSFRSMPEAARPAFAAEKTLCVDALQAQRALTASPNRTGSFSGLEGAAVAMATVRGTPKLYAVGGTTGNLSLAPLRVVRPKPAAELEARMVALGQADEALKLVRKLAPGSRYHVSRYSVIASASPAHSEQKLRELGARIDDFIEFLKEVYALDAPPTYITLYLYPDIPALRRAALRLHGMEANDATLGYSFGNDRSILAMLTGTAAGTLLHEVFHMVVHESFGSIPQWLDEGMASLYETATASDGLYFGEPNWRSPVFARLRISMAHIPLRELVTAPWFSDEPAIHRQLGERVYDAEAQAFLLAYARMFALYLQETRSLTKVFNAFRHRVRLDEYVPAKQRAVTLLEEALVRPLGQIESDFMAWAPVAFDQNTRFYANSNRAQTIRKELPQRAFVGRELPKAVLEREAVRE